MADYKTELIALELNDKHACHMNIGAIPITIYLNLALRGKLFAFLKKKSKLSVKTC